MSHKNQSPIEANGTHAKFEFSICSILESPLHCWPLNTLFYEDKIEGESLEVKLEKNKKLKKSIAALILFILAL